MISTSETGERKCEKIITGEKAAIEIYDRRKILSNYVFM